MSLRKSMQRFIKGLKPAEPSWSDRKHAVNFLLDNDNLLDIGEIKKIYQTGSYRADGSYLAEIKRILQTGRFSELSSLNTKREWGEDEIGAIPIGNSVDLYLLVFKNDTFMVKAVLLQDNGAAPVFITRKVIEEKALQYFKLNKKIFPYD